MFREYLFVIVAIIYFSGLGFLPLEADAACSATGSPVERDYPTAALDALLHAGNQPGLLIGDSIAAYWPADSIAHWLGAPVENLGYPEDTPANLLWRLGRIQAPRSWHRIVLIVGVNAVWNDPVCHNVAADVEAVVRALKRLSPAADLAVLSVMPFGRNLKESLDRNAPINSDLSAAASGLGYRFIDVGPRMVAQCSDGGSCPLLRDALHPTPQGYAMIGKMVRQAYGGQRSR